MEKHTIGLNAGHIWQILSDNEPRTYKQLKEESGLAERDLNMALGWLAREDQIEIEQGPDKDEFVFSIYFNNYF
ncbi:winged helix-turn-helix domain-containing protein [Bacteroides fragilis]|uniref:winged helix-turn-helix domain-containing protein n=1 Tax=Bacteroides fragilis TaxID=817 RepID=UPI00202E50A9|nr:winged helix-turn-helix domain-containing protein [Bacteroides fragilis]MCM0221089.1 winged helix-turn-helix domain-containing protein [Bacteroides fragilis]MCM0269415.1 winged helix-turn-helix domain-containing protein [Bacteroides fragilis]